MELSWREIASFSLNWGILEEKTRDLWVKWRFRKRKRMIFASMEILEEKSHDFRFNGGFAKRKRVSFA